MTAALSALLADWWPEILGGLALIAGLLGVRWEARRDGRRDAELAARREQDRKREQAQEAGDDAREDADGRSDADLLDRLRKRGWGP